MLAFSNRSVEFPQLPPVASWRGRPRQFIMEYWQTGNQTRMNKTFPTNVRQLTSSAALSVNVTVECYKEYKVKMRMCTVECGEWSTVISIPADKQSSTLAAFRKKGKNKVTIDSESSGISKWLK